MTTTIAVTLDNDGKPITHNAEYFQVEDGFMILKNPPGKIVAAYPVGRVKGIVTGVAK